VITLVEYKAKLDDHGNPLRDASGRLIKGEISRYVVMEKRTGWGAEYPPEKRNGEWGLSRNSRGNASNVAPSSC
jgi:hypothetical protein